MKVLFAMLGLGLGLAVLFPAEVRAVTAPGRPDIIVILGDDMGFSDLGCYGGEIQTPNLDGLAQGGLRFTQFYNTARCCPSRAALLTGLYPHQAGIGHMMEDRGLEGYRGELNRECVTLAEMLKPAGYRTYAVGKWHVTKKVKPEGDGEKANWPLQRGFDRFYGTIHGAGSFFDPNTLTRDNRFISPYADPEYQPEQYYYTDAISDHAVRFISDHSRDHKNEPLFMYVAYTAAHWPMQAKESDIAKYKGKYARGYGETRKARLRKMQELGVAGGEMAPQRGGKWADVKDRAYEERCMEVYAAMVDCMDQGIGRIVAELKRQGRLGNTLILFMQDNGGCAEGIGRGGKKNAPPAVVARADSPTLPPLAPDYLQPDMIPKQTRDGFPMRQGYGVPPGAADTFCGYGEAWANVSNTPFREYKHWVHEGGISTPLIVHWPDGTRVSGKHEATTPRGVLIHEPAHLIDIMATVVDVSGAAYPKAVAGRDILPMEGVSLVPLFQAQPFTRKEPLFWEHEANRAVREGKWKLVAKGPQGPWELHDMHADRAELHDLAAQQPERVQAMAAQWEAWARRARVLPWIWDGKEEGGGSKAGAKAE